MDLNTLEQLNKEAQKVLDETSKEIERLRQEKKDWIDACIENATVFIRKRLTYMNKDVLGMELGTAAGTKQSKAVVMATTYFSNIQLCGDGNFKPLYTPPTYTEMVEAIQIAKRHTLKEYNNDKHTADEN